MVRKVLRILKWVGLGTAVAACVIFVVGFIVLWLWNWLMPDIFGLPRITLWQAWGLLILAHLLLGAGQISHESHGKAGDSFRREVKERLSPSSPVTGSSGQAAPTG
jgi:hypothetical protein